MKRPVVKGLILDPGVVHGKSRKNQAFFKEFKGIYWKMQGLVNLELTGKSEQMKNTKKINGVFNDNRAITIPTLLLEKEIHANLTMFTHLIKKTYHSMTFKQFIRI